MNELGACSTVLEERRASGFLSARRRIALVAFSLLALGLVLAARFAVKAEQTSRSLELPTLGKIPRFEMRDQAGVTVTDQDFQQRVSIVDFFFTSCPVMCPKLAVRMASLRDRLQAQQSSSKRRVQLVSISVDPETDTPERLHEYAARYNADRKSWSFLTGEAGDLHRIVVGGFKTEYRKADSSLGIAEIMHGNWFILVDAAGQIRGYYLADQAAEVERLTVDARALSDW